MARGRPSKKDEELGIIDQEIQDTMYWCGIIKIQSRQLSLQQNDEDKEMADNEIECKLKEARLELLKLEGKSEEEIKKIREDDKEPNGRQFTRHRNGIQRMTHLELVNFVKVARHAGLLPPKMNFGSIDKSESESRLHKGAMNEDGKSKLLAELSAFKELRDAKLDLAKAANRFQTAAQEAEKLGLDIFDTPTPNPHSLPDALLETVDTMTIAQRIGEIASWCFYRGHVHGLEESFAIKKIEPVQRRYKKRTGEDKKNTNTAANLLSTHMQKWCTSDRK